MRCKAPFSQTYWRNTRVYLAPGLPTVNILVNSAPPPPKKTKKIFRKIGK